VKEDANSIHVEHGVDALRSRFDVAAVQNGHAGDSGAVESTEKRRSAKAPRPANDHEDQLEALPPPALDIFDVGDEDGILPPRGWLLGNSFCRKVLSGLIAAGGSGKTTVRIAQALALSTGRPITGEHVFVRAKVLIVCLEDDLIELRRRVWAAMMHHRVDSSDVAGYLFLTTPRGLKIAEYGGERAPRIIQGELYKALSATIERLKVDLLCIDPAVKAHALEENDNPAIDAFATLLTDLAAERDVAIDLLSHERKSSGEPGDANRGRGAGSQKDAARLVYTLTPMSEDDAKPFGVGNEERRFLVRVDSAKVNIAPPSTKATWFKLVGVNLGNGNATYPNGDTVQTIEAWTPAPLFDGLTDADLNKVLRRINAGIGNGQRYSLAGAARERAAWRAVQREFPEMGESRCKAIIATWSKNGVFETGEYDDPVRRTKAIGILSATLVGETEGDQ
jgi:hypothetical protein